jgi:hypothetical protein
MKNWTDFEREQPQMAARGRELIYRNGDGEGLLVSVSATEPPRIHPVNAGIVDGHFYTFVQGGSGKRRDLDSDGRYAFHTVYDPQAPSEFLVRGRVAEVKDADLRARIARNWYFNVADSYPLYELMIEHAMLGERPTANDWPPKYTSWKASPKAD